MKNHRLNNFYRPKDLTGALAPDEEGDGDDILTVGELLTCGVLLNVLAGGWL